MDELRESGLRRSRKFNQLHWSLLLSMNKFEEMIQQKMTVTRSKNCFPDEPGRN